MVMTSGVQPTHDNPDAFPMTLQLIADMPEQFCKVVSEIALTMRSVRLTERQDRLTA